MISQLRHIQIKARLYQLRKPDNKPAEYTPFDPTNTGHHLRPDAVANG
jgi:hypothetical protein